MNEQINCDGSGEVLWEIIDRSHTQVFKLGEHELAGRLELTGLSVRVLPRGPAAIEFASSIVLPASFALGIVCGRLVPGSSLLHLHRDKFERIRERLLALIIEEAVQVRE